jgi:hypothetical protein
LNPGGDAEFLEGNETSDYARHEEMSGKRVTCPLNPLQTHKGNTASTAPLRNPLFGPK